ncbi:hypothetical protein ymoll0001_20710 [Yersinia mollaretii ATCC 43969]|nr:hypothetical protein ymoll0001_20710 [Yersinia mollaretii ATCC 43969]
MERMSKGESLSKEEQRELQDQLTMLYEQLVQLMRKQAEEGEDKKNHGADKTDIKISVTPKLTNIDVFA